MKVKTLWLALAALAMFFIFAAALAGLIGFFIARFLAAKDKLE